MSLSNLLIFISMLLGATVDADSLASNGVYEKKSSAVYGSPALRLAHRSSSAHRREADGATRRFARQADSEPLAYTLDETRALLNAHIEYRRNVTPSAADMNMIAWNTELADLARGWAERCQFEHGFPSDPQAYNGLVAQNIWQGSQSFGLTRSVTAWYDENKDYDYATESCSAECGHYRVMVFSGLETIGCGSAMCDGGRQIFTVCNYGPSVPSIGVPYKAGPACALCSSGTGWCDDKLCGTDCDTESESCKCNLQCQNCGELDSAQCKCTCKAGWRGTDCSELCMDYKDYCGVYTAQACVGDTGAQKDCPATCELCALVSDSTAADAKCCDGKICDAGDVLNESSCECVDYVEKTTPQELEPGNAAAPIFANWMCVSVLAVFATSMQNLIG